MLVKKSEVEQILKSLEDLPELGLDTETFGLSRQDDLFAIIIASPKESYYFNFLGGLGVPEDCLLKIPDVFPSFELLFSKKDITWFLHNAKFDMQKLALNFMYLEGSIHDTEVAERILCNDRLKYSLADVAKEYGLKKDTAVDEYMKRHRLKSYAEVPLEIMQKYGERDAELVLQIGVKQREAIGAS